MLRSAESSGIWGPAAHLKRQECASALRIVGSAHVAKDMVSSEPEPEPDERFSFGLSTSAPLLGPGEYLKHRWPESGATAAAEERPLDCEREVARADAVRPLVAPVRALPRRREPDGRRAQGPGALERASPRVRTTRGTGRRRTGCACPRPSGHPRVRGAREPRAAARRVHHRALARPRGGRPPPGDERRRRRRGRALRPPPTARSRGSTRAPRCPRTGACRRSAPTPSATRARTTGRSPRSRSWRPASRAAATSAGSSSTCRTRRTCRPRRRSPAGRRVRGRPLRAAPTRAR